MALFQRQPIELSQSLPYTLSLNTKTVLVVGLGNPGKDYNLTRHNIGFYTLDDFAQSNEFPDFKEHSKFKGFTTEKVLGQTKVILLKPGTFMNNSGEAVQAVASYHKIAPQDIICVYDELSIPFGQIRMRVGGQSAGHNGIKSLIQHVGHNFGRVRIGIKNSITEKADDSDFVLGKFTKTEQQHLKTLSQETGAVITEFIYSNKLPHETRSIIL